jgi:hypothetical protein
MANMNNFDWRRAQALLTTVIDWTPFIRLDEVPSELAALFREYKGSPYVERGGYLYALQKDWLDFLAPLLDAELEKRNVRAQAEAPFGPSEQDLEEAPYLEIWSPFLNERTSTIHLVGRVSGHPYIRGPYMATSPLKGMDGTMSWARTLSRWYRLGQPVSEQDIRLAYPLISPNAIGLDPVELSQVMAKALRDERARREN